MGNYKKIDYSKIDWTKADELIAFEQGCCAQNIRKLRKKLNMKKAIKPSKTHINWDLVPFESFDCTTIGAMLGLTYTIVCRKRKELGMSQTHSNCVDDFDWDKVKKNKFFRINPKIDWENIGLGTKPDAHLAKELNLTQSAIFFQRTKRGIISFRKNKRIQK